MPNKYRIPIDPSNPTGDRWYVEQYSRTFLFYCPNSSFLFTSLAASDITEATKIVRMRWEKIPVARRNRWYSREGLNAKFDWTKCPAYDPTRGRTK